MKIFSGFVDLVIIMSSERYIPSRRNLQIDISNFWINNETVEKQFHSYLHSTRLAEQDMYYSKKLIYDKELAKVLGIKGAGRILPYNIADRRKSPTEDWPVMKRKKPVNKPRLAALDLPNIRTDICCNVLNWSSSNHIIAALSKIIYLWHVPSSTMTKSIKCNYEITSLQMNKDSTILAFAGEELDSCEIKFWYVNTSNILQVTNPVDCNHKNCYVTCIEYHPSNKYIILGCRRGHIVVKTSTEMTNASTTKDAHNSRDVIKIKCSPDGKFVATSGFDGFVRVWSFPHLEPICSHQEAFCSKGISWHPWKCTYLCIGTTNGSLSLINISTGKVIAHIRDNQSIIYDITFNKLSGELVTSHSVSNRDTSVLTFHSQINVLSNFHQVVDRFEGHCRKVLFLEWSPDNQTLASAGSDETIHLWKFFEEPAEKSKNEGVSKSILNLDNFIR